MFFDRAKAELQKVMPDPSAYEKTLPPFDQVVAKKDVQNLKNYGGLSEAYFYQNDLKNGNRLYKQFAPRANTILPPADTFKAGVSGDIGIYYFTHKNYAAAKPLLLESTQSFEKHLNSANANNLVSNYLCLSLIFDKEHKTPTAQNYAKKMADLLARQRR